MILNRLIRHKCLWKRLFIKRNKYIVLLPEVPPDTAENNPLLRTKSLPAFNEITHQHCFNAIGKLVIEYECGIKKLDDKLSDPKVPKSVQNVILPLDQLSAPLDFAWASFKMLYILGYDKRISNLFLMLNPRFQQAKQEPYTSKSLYNAFKELNAQKDLAEPAKRVAQKYLIGSHLSGMDLSDRKHEQYKNTSIKLQQHQDLYRKKLAHCTSMFSQSLTMSDVQNFPKDFLEELSENKSNLMNGPWKVTFVGNVYQRFMELCENRTLRWNVWHAKQVLASAVAGSNLNNSLEIEEIRYNRKELAAVLGYESYADMSMKTKMAGSVKNVMALITTLHVKGHNTVLKEVQELQDFAVEMGADHHLELWDVPFWQRKHREHLYKIDQEAVRQYFPLTTVLKGLFDHCKNLFGVSIIQSTSPVETWHEDVMYFKVFDHNELPVASFYIDPYFRPPNKTTGAWLEIGRNRSDVVGTEPLSYLSFNFQPPQSGVPSLISFDELIVLFQKFGHLLQHSLTSAPYNDVAGLTNLEWDTVNVCPLFMSHWLFNYDVIANLSGHVKTGERLPVELHQRLINDRNYMQNYRLNHELYLSALDMELYGNKKRFWLDVIKELWAQFIPFPFTKGQAHPCSFPEIFCGQMAAGYYSTIWSEMVAADLFGAFEEVGLDNKEKISQLGKRLKESFISVSGSCDPNEAFRQFRGRDPSADAIVSRYGLQDAFLKQLEN